MTHRNLTTNSMNSIDDAITFVLNRSSNVKKKHGTDFKTAVANISQTLVEGNPDRKIKPVTESVRWLACHGEFIGSLDGSQAPMPTNLLEPFIQNLQKLGFSDIGIFLWLAGRLKSAQKKAQPLHKEALGNACIWLIDRTLGPRQFARLPKTEEGLLDYVKKSWGLTQQLGASREEATYILKQKIGKIPNRFGLPLEIAYSWLKEESSPQKSNEREKSTNLPTEENLSDTTALIMLDPNDLGSLRRAMEIRSLDLEKVPKPSFPWAPNGVREVKLVGLAEVRLPEGHEMGGRRISLSVLESCVDQPSPDTTCSCGRVGETGHPFIKVGFQEKPRIMHHGLHNQWVLLSILRTRRWECPVCKNRPTHVYSMIEPNATYTKDCKENVVHMANLSTAKGAADFCGLPEKTVYGMSYGDFLPEQREMAESAALRKYHEREASIEKIREIATRINDSKEQRALFRSLDLDSVDVPDELQRICQGEERVVLCDLKGRVLSLSSQDWRRLCALCKYRIICIDDTSKRKGKKYVTVISDLIHGTTLAVIEGRSMEEVEKDIEENYPHLLNLKPCAVVIDRAAAYRNFAEKYYENATIIHDRFHIIMNIRDHSLHPILTSSFRSKNFGLSVDKLFTDLVRKSFYGQLSYEEELVLEELVQHLPRPIQAKYENIRQIRERFCQLCKHGELSRDDMDGHALYLRHLHGDLISEYTHVSKKGKREYMSKIKQATRGILKNRYFERMDSQPRAFIEKILEYTSSWSYLGEAYRFVAALGHWYDHDFDTLQEACDALRTLIEVGLESQCEDIQKAAKSLEFGEDLIANYHICRVTNGVAEGKNGLIKSIMRWHFGVKNDENYINLIMVRSNRHLFTVQRKPRYTRVRRQSA